MTVNVGVITPSNNLNQWSRNYYPAMFLGNTSIVQFLNEPLAAATNSYTYVTGSIISVYTSGPNIGQYVNYLTGATNGQQTAVAILVDTRIISGLTTPASTDRYTLAYGSCNLFLQYLSTSVGTSADVLVALATMGARVYNSTFAYIP